MTSTTTPTQKFKQRSDLTFKQNKQHGRHGWLRLTPAYGVKIVDEILASHHGRARILDPFSGTGTTTLCAAYDGHEGVSLDINPFLIWFGNAKLRSYKPSSIVRALEQARAAVRDVAGGRALAVEAPPIHNIERWWEASALQFLCALKGAILERTKGDDDCATLLKVAFCRTVISTSNAAFNHQSMSFKNKKGEEAKQISLIEVVPNYGESFLKDVQVVLDSANDNPEGKGSVVLMDSRNVDAAAPIVAQGFDLLVTSPPYPNRMSYIRELRPYMYWLDFLVEAKEAGDLDWKAIGGTWGSATSKLNDWRPDPNVPSLSYLAEAVERVQRSHDKNGHLLGTYITKYFEDMALHFDSVSKVLKPGARAHYIIGNSTFYGVMVPAERIYKDMMEASGFVDVTIKVIRKRNSKKELFEFDVHGRKG